MMGRTNSTIVLALVGFFLLFTVVVNASQNNATNCPGPIKYYKVISCKPIQGDSDSGCPVRYDCADWENLSDDECLYNGKKYQKYEKLRGVEDPCEPWLCSGIRGWPIIAYLCASGRRHDYGPDGEAIPCYDKNTPTQCCSYPTVCLQKGQTRPTCIVDGKTYQDGEFFIPPAEPNKRCYCGEGYTGENIEPFCMTPDHSICDSEFYRGSDIRRGCIPVYENDQSPQKDCNSKYRCPNNDDYVIKRIAPSTLKPNELENNDMLCKFGNLTMEIGDELNGGSESACVKCVCEVPPTPTCQLRPTAECNPHGSRRLINDKDY